MSSKSTLKIITILWMLALAGSIAYAVRHCSLDRHRELAPLSSGLRDSLLTADIDGCRRIDYRGFTVWFDSARHIPACVTYELTIGHLDGAHGRTDRFERDHSVAGCPDPDAYYGTGLHRGHMAPAGDMAWDSTAISQSFLMTNICPQHRSLNEGGWARLEQKCREWVQRDSVLIIATGPVREKGLDTIAGSGVAIPKRFFKVVMAPCTRPRRAIAFIYDNGACNDRLKRYAVSVDDVERLTGIDFFTALPSQEQEHIESARNLQVWLH